MSIQNELAELVQSYLVERKLTPTAYNRIQAVYNIMEELKSTNDIGDWWITKDDTIRMTAPK